jgi:hypothetical protein
MGGVPLLVSLLTDKSCRHLLRASQFTYRLSHWSYMTYVVGKLISAPHVSSQKCHAQRCSVFSKISGKFGQFHGLLPNGHDAAWWGQHAHTDVNNISLMQYQCRHTRRDTPMCARIYLHWQLSRVNLFDFRRKFCKSACDWQKLPEARAVI